MRSILFEFILNFLLKFFFFEKLKSLFQKELLVIKQPPSPPPLCFFLLFWYKFTYHIIYLQADDSKKPLNININKIKSTLNNNWHFSSILLLEQKERKWNKEATLFWLLWLVRLMNEASLHCCSTVFEFWKILYSLQIHTILEVFCGLMQIYQTHTNHDQFSMNYPIT